MPRRIALLLTLAFIFACSQPPNADSARCSPCEIVLRRVGELSDSAEPGLLPNTMVYAERDAAGRLYTTSRTKDAVLVFNGDGGLLQRLGTVGDGPGEFRMVRRTFVGPGDSVFVTDWSLRVQVFSPGLRFVRTFIVPHPPSLILADGSFVVAEQLGAPERARFPLHHLKRDGTLGSSFGADSTRYNRDQNLINKRLAFADDSGGLLTVAPGRFTIERWDPVRGERKQTIVVRSDWFTEVAAWPNDERTRPPAVIESLWEDDGLIWLLFRVSDEDWVAPAHANSERSIDSEEYDATYDWIVEAVDPHTELVVASKRFRKVLWGRPPSRVLVTEERSDSDVMRFSVWQPALQQQAVK